MTSSTLLSRVAALIALSTAMPALSDGSLDPAWADSGRSVVGFLESDSVALRAFAQASVSGRLWIFGDDPQARNQLYMARLLPDGTPDPAFGSNADGRRRLALPANLITQPERLAVTGALVQADGKPLVFGGLRPDLDENGVFPGLVCRLAVAGTLDASFGGGCVLLRSFLHADETCQVTDAASAPDDKLVVVGACTAPSFPSRPFITRLNANGSVDIEFAAGSGLLLPLLPDAIGNDQHAAAVVVRPDGYIAVLAHASRDIGGRRHFDAAILQFDGGGSIDPDFGSNGLAWLPSELDADEYGRDLLLRPDGRLLALAQRRRPDAWNERALLAQFATDGMLDTAFGNAGVREDDFGGQLGPGSSLRSLSLDASGRVVLAGARGAAPSASMSHAGTEFWLAMWENVPPAMENELLLSSEVATSGHAWVPGLGLTLPFTVTPGLLTRVKIPREAEVLIPDTVADIGIRVSTQHPVTLHVVGGRSSANVGGARVSPSARLGTSHRLLGWGPGVGESFGSAFIVAATEDATTITLTPNVGFGVRPGGVPFNIVLQRGQAYYFGAGSGIDLTGTTLVANHPVAVFGGNRCAFVPFVDVPACDLVVEQQLPDGAHGRDFATLPMPGRNGGDIVRILAIENGTGVQIDDAPPVQLNAGEVYDVFRQQPTRINTSKPAAVAQFASGNNLDEPDTDFGDPLMLDIVPREAWHARWTASVVRRPLELNTVYTLRVIAPASAVGSVRVDGVAVSPASFIAIGGGLVGAHVVVQPGSYQVSSPMPIAVSVMGTGSVEAYGYPASGSPSGVDADGEDLIARYLPDGNRDPGFGAAGLVFIDHREAYGSALPSFDIAQRAIVVGGEVLVATASNNGASGQRVFLAYRLRAGTVFRDGFESVTH